MAVLARWLIDNAASGTMSGTLADDTGNSNTLTVDNTLSDGTWTSVAAGNGLTANEADKTASSMICELVDISTNGNIGASLASATSASVVLVADLDNTAPNEDHVFHIGTLSGNGDINVQMAAKFQVKWNAEVGTDFVRYNYPIGLTVITIVVDSTEAVQADRCKVYYDGVLQSATAGGITLNESLTAVNNTNRYCSLFNRPTQNRNARGSLYYAELHDVVLSAAQVTSLTSALLADNDADWQAASTLTIDTPPTDVRATESRSIVVSNPATVPTVGNTTVKLVDAAGPSATTDSVTGVGPYTINFTFPRTTAKLFDATGYALYVVVDAESATSIVVPYLPATGMDFIDLSSPVNTAGTLGETYAGTAAATSDQWVHDLLLTGDATVGMDVDAQGYWILDGTPSITSTADFYRIDSLGTVDVEDTITFEVVVGSDVPADSRTSVFHIANYLRSLGTYNNSQCNELVVEWLVSEGVTRTQINQMLYGYLGGLGYTGSFNDRLKAWSEDV